MHQTSAANVCRFRSQSRTALWQSFALAIIPFWKARKTGRTRFPHWLMQHLGTWGRTSTPAPNCRTKRYSGTSSWAQTRSALPAQGWHATFVSVLAGWKLTAVLLANFGATRRSPLLQLPFPTLLVASHPQFVSSCFPTPLCLSSLLSFVSSYCHCYS